MNAISSPPAGLMIFNTTVNSIFWFNGTTWDMGINRDGNSCGSVSYGGQVYTSVIIGTQCWMKENLNVGTAVTGTANQENNGVIEKYCYENKDAKCAIYGGLYQWDEMMQYVTFQGTQGICPSGWHIPSDEEWTKLSNYLGGESEAGGKVKEEGTVHWYPPNVATNSSGFTGLPGGYRNSSGSFLNLEYAGFYWSSSQSSTLNAWYRDLYYNNTVMTRNNWDKVVGFSVRCLKN